jgi:hypothetical protein
MRVWLGTVTPGQKGQTRGSSSARDVDVREESKEEVRCFFTGGAEDECPLQQDHADVTDLMFLLN